jgi:hypothetical protein
MRRFADAELVGTLEVDLVGGGQLPFFSVRGLREVGVFRPDLFFGFEELEFGLRAQRAGWKLLLDGPAQLEERRAFGRLGIEGLPRDGPSTTNWRIYYPVRNHLWILRESGLRRAATYCTARYVARAFVAMLTRPRAAGTTMAMSAVAILDAWRSRLGRRIDPLENPARLPSPGVSSGTTAGG